MKDTADIEEKMAGPRVTGKTLQESLDRACDFLLSIQSPGGYWVGELEADVSVTAGYIPVMYFMTGHVDAVRQQKVINFVKSKQRPDGSWSSYYGGPGDLNVTIQAYFALKLSRIPATDPFMQKARHFVVTHGGIGKANTITRIWLALFGQFDWRGTPSIPPEIVLLPNWSYLNIGDFASWSRATIMALTVIMAKKPTCLVPPFAQVSELWVEPEGQRTYSRSGGGNVPGWDAFFLSLDRFFKFWERLPWKPGRSLALRKTEKWIVDHQESDGSWAGIMLPWVYSLFALKALGYSLSHPVVERGIKGLEDFICEDGTTVRLQPATSPVWDTAWAVLALRESGLAADHPSLVRAARWLLHKEIHAGGDWQMENRSCVPGCWSFEFENNFYPDIDDTAVVPRALLQVSLPGQEEKQKTDAIMRGLNWVVGMQSDDGGWAAFDRNNNKRLLAHVPFADFMTPLDPTSPDVSAHAIELLGSLNVRGRTLERALSFIKRAQGPDGAWYGRWGVNYIYGTGLVLTSLGAARQDMREDGVLRAVSWLEKHQNSDGSWGETCLTYDDPACRGTGPGTASQTAWALMGLLAVPDLQDSQSVKKGIGYLLDSQREDGSWTEEAYTGTGFPRAFYLRYDLYRIYFPLMALARYRTALEVNK